MMRASHQVGHQQHQHLGPQAEDAAAPPEHTVGPVRLEQRRVDRLADEREHAGVLLFFDDEEAHGLDVVVGSGRCRHRKQVAARAGLAQLERGNGALKATGRLDTIAIGRLLRSFAAHCA
jgi:hypothetical protein